MAGFDGEERTAMMTQSQLDKLYQLEELVDDILSDEPSDDAILTMEKPDVLFDIYAQIHKLHTLLQN